MRLRTRYNVKYPTALGLVLDLPFFEGSGSIAHDMSGKDNHGSIEGATWGTDEEGALLKFNGSPDYVDCGKDESLDITDEVTIEARINEAVRGASHKILSRRTGLNFYYLGCGNGLPGGGIGDGTTHSRVDNDSYIPLNETHCLLFVFIDADNYGYFYYDGVVKNDGAISESIGDLSGIKLSVGADSEGTNYFFEGKIENIRLYKTALTDVTIKRRYEQPDKDYCRGS